MFKSVIKSDDKEAEVLEYRPEAIKQRIPNSAVPFVRNQGIPNNDFIMSDLIAYKTGVKEREHANYLKDLEKGVLEKLKEVQEPAYKEAYDLGFKDGQEKAYTDNSNAIKAALEQFAAIVESIKNLKTDLMVANEAHLVKLVHDVARVIALSEISQKKESITAVLAQALKNAQSDEEIRVKINPKDLEFLNTVKGRHGDPLEKLPKVVLEGSENVTPGGCLIETNYGAIDATIETRVQEVWKSLESHIPKGNETA